MTNSSADLRERKTTKPEFPGSGGARRDRTDDLKLAKLPLSQLSYGPFWVVTDAVEGSDTFDDWWAWEDLNLRPHAYQARALTN